MRSYDKALQPHGYHRGSSHSIAKFDKFPIGMVRNDGKWYAVSLWASRQMLKGDINGRGVIWYELDEIRRSNEFKVREMEIPSALRVPNKVTRDIRVFPVDQGPITHQVQWSIAVTVAGAVGWATWLAIGGASAGSAGYSSAIAGTITLNASMASMGVAA
jgi:hypothetical protein